jgi:hypothetical protein
MQLYNKVHCKLYGKFSLHADNTSLKAVGVSSPFVLVFVRPLIVKILDFPRSKLVNSGYDKILRDWNFRPPSNVFWKA